MSTILQDLISKHENLKIREDSKLIEDSLGNLFIYKENDSSIALKINAANGSLQVQELKKFNIKEKGLEEVKSALPSQSRGGD